MNKTRLAAIIAVAVVVAGLIVYGFMPAALPVDASKASTAPMRVAVEEEGRTRVVDRFVVSAPSSGYLRRIELKAGDKVAKGQVVAVLDPVMSDQLDPRSRAAAEAAAAAAEASLESAAENAKGAAAARAYQRGRMERLEKLFGQGLVSRDEFDAARSEADRSESAFEAAVASSKAALHEAERARAALIPASALSKGGGVRVLSPADGSVLKLHKESEGAVTAGQPLIDVGDPARVEVIAELLSADAVRVRPGMRVEFKRWGGAAPLTGKVTVVEPSGFTKVSSLGVEEQRVVVTSEITTPHAERPGLGDGYRVEAAFIVNEVERALQIPASALFMKPDGTYWVFVISDGRATARKVDVRMRNGIAAAIGAGLAEGEVVVTHPDDTVSEGARVKAR